MSSILCLVADPQVQPMTAGLATELARQLGGTLVWLAEGRAVDIACPDLDPATVRERAAPWLEPLPLDWAALPVAGRRKRLLLADMDSTMITIECIDELADAVGLREQVAAITARAMNGELDFRAALEARVALLADLEASIIDAICRERVQASPGAAVLIATMRALGARTVLVSGGFRQFTSHVRRLLGFDVDEANGLEIVGDRLTGRLEGPIRDARAKLEALQRHAGELGLTPADVVALGDGANDLPMLQAAGLGIAYRAHATVRAAISCRIEHTDLTTALFFQGIPARDFVDPAG